MANPTPSCSILVVSSNVKISEQLVNRLITLTCSGNTTVQLSSQTINKTEHIPWTISNDYYTAPVHFVLRETHEIPLSSTNEVPAFIFVFDPIASEDYQIMFTRLLQFLKDSDFEVSLAVSISGADADEPTEEQQEVYDSFFSSLGFEYINGHMLDHRAPSQHDTKTFDGIPGLGRIVDSLSTVPWPSMVRKSPYRKTSGIISLQNEEESLRSLLNSDPDILGTSRTQEMAALERWLQTADIEGEGDDDSWLEGQYNLLPNSKSPRSLEQPGFDDNFSDFVSAPPAPIQSSNNEVKTLSLYENEETTGYVMEPPKHGIHDDDDIGRYDFSHVLAGLEAVKTKIAGIQDERERRKVAAKVALGVAYGFSDPNHDFEGD